LVTGIFAQPIDTGTKSFPIATKSYNSFNALHNSSNEIIFISDTQDLIFFEYLWNETNNNQEVRQIIYNDIIERKPSSVFHLGDLVALGFLEEDWKHIDNFVERLYKKGIPFYPVLGNHELMFKPQKGEANFQKRFPQHSRTGYLVIIDSVSVILLNSNFGNMTDEEITEQVQ